MADFYGIDLRGRIIIPAPNGTKAEYDLWLNDSTQVPELPFGLKDLSFVQEVTVTIGLSLNSKVSLTLNPPLEEGLAIIHSPLLNWAGSMLEVTIGYSTGGDGLTGTNVAPQRFGGLMMKPDVRISGQDISITLNALGVAYGMNLSNATSVRTYPAGTSPWEAVRDTFVALGYSSIKDENTVFGDSISANQRVKNSASGHPFFQPVKKGKATQPQVDTISNGTVDPGDQFESINKGPRNDWWFVRETIKSYNLDLLIRDQQVFIKDPQKWKTDPPKFTFVLRGNIDTDINSANRIYPILEYSTPSAYVWLAPGSGGLVQSDVSADKKQEQIKITSDDPNAIAIANSTSSSGGTSWIDSLISKAKINITQAIEAHKAEVARTDVGAVKTINNSPTGSGGNDAAQVFSGSPEDANHDQALAEYRNFNHDRGIQAEVTTLGIPELLPALVVSISGLTPNGVDSQQSWFDGKYGVMMVEHTIGTSGMTTRFKGLKNFHPTQMQSGIEGTGPVNNHEDIDPNQANSSDYTTVNPRPS